MPFDIGPGNGDRFLFDDTFDQAQWREAVDLFSPTQLSMGRKSSYATLTAYVPFEQLRACVIWLMGFSEITNDKTLKRRLPASHPVWYGLYASEIVSCVGVKFVRKANSTISGALPFATYQLAKLTVAYNQVPYAIVSDNDSSLGSISDPARESRRFVSRIPKPYVDMLEMPGGTVLFDAPGS
jgi:hypothetical protein